MGSESHFIKTEGRVYIRGKLTDSKFSHMCSLAIYFNWILHKTFVMTFITFLHSINVKGAGVVSVITLEPKLIADNLLAIFLPLELKVVSCGFNSKGCGYPGCY